MICDNIDGYWECFAKISYTEKGKCNGTPLQYSCLENPMDGGAWWAAVHGVAEGRIRLSDFTFTFHFHALEKEMATQSHVLAWRIPGMREPGGLPSMGSHRVGHDWSDLAAAVGIYYGLFIQAFVDEHLDDMKKLLYLSSAAHMYTFLFGIYA